MKQRHPETSRLLALIQANQKAPGRQYRLTRNDAGEPTIFLYDVIDPLFGISAERFVKDLTALEGSTIHVRINSPGGDVFEGRAIATAIRQHRSKIVSHVDGVALSAASWIALAANEVEIADGGFFMIHRSWALAFGNAEQLKEMAALLEKIDDDLVREYVAETGQGASQVREWIDAETWFNADEAIQYGFADRKTAEFGEADNSWELSAYRHVPTSLGRPAARGVDSNQEYEEARRKLRARSLCTSEATVFNSKQKYEEARRRFRAR